MASENYMNVPKSTMSQFFDDLEAKLALITGIVDMRKVGITLEDARKPVMVIGQPGIGKTAGIMSIIRNINARLKSEGRTDSVGLKKILLGQTVVGSMTGIPVHLGDGRVVRVQVPDLPDPERDPKYGVLFLDELTTADEAQVQPALGLTDDSRNIGEYTLPEGWMVVAAGNGPDCSNFLRLDDMTISRFFVYDIAYNFQSDWRGYANRNGVESDIIAFLNFSPTSCMRMESTENDISGKLFPCPRSWERLSNELKIRRATGRPVMQSEMAQFAGRVVGLKAAREFQAFTAYAEKVKYSPKKIIAGTEEPPSADIEKQVYFIVLQNCMKLVVRMVEEDGASDGDELKPEAAQAISNVIRWFLAMERYDLESTFSAIISLKNDHDVIASFVRGAQVDNYCPELSDFIERNFEGLMEAVNTGAFNELF